MKKTKFIIALLAAGMLLSGCAEGGYVAATDAPGDISGGGDTDVSYPTDTTGNLGDVKLQSGDLYTIITVKGHGDITIKLFPQYAPVAVENFKKLADSGYYEGKSVHRVISDFMLQGGSYDGTGASAPNEESYGIEVAGEMRHYYGALCMANAMGQNGTQFYIVNSKDTAAFEELASQLSVIEKSIPELEGYLAEAIELVEAGEMEEMAITYYDSMLQMYKNMADMIKNASDDVKAKYKSVGGTAQLDGGYTVFGQTVDGFDVIDSISAIEVADSGSGEVSSPVTPITIEKVVVKTY